MENLAKISTICLFFLTVLHPITTYAARRATWDDTNLCLPREKYSNFTFYIQDALGEPNPTIYEVARATITATSPTMFGQVRVLDDLITAEPDRNSTKLGRAQGLITSADFQANALAMNLNFVFTADKYNGSTLSILGRNPIMSRDRELPIVGGTGVFRMARGYTISNTFSYDAVENYGVLEYTAYVCHKY